MEYLLTILLFTNPADPTYYETTTLEVESFEVCVETGYNVVNLYSKLFVKAEIKCDKL